MSCINLFAQVVQTPKREKVGSEEEKIEPINTGYYETHT